MAGTNVSVAQRYDGTTISGGGRFRIVGYADISGVTRGFLYDGSTFTDIFVPGSTRTEANGIQGSNIVGQTRIDGITRGFLYDGSTFTDIFVPCSTATQANGIERGQTLLAFVLLVESSVGFLITAQHSPHFRFLVAHLPRLMALTAQI